MTRQRSACLLFFAGVMLLRSVTSMKCSLKHKPASPPFDAVAIAKVQKYFFKNINVNGTGAVVAAPDPHAEALCPGLNKQNNYVYHWARDGALTMRTVLLTSASRETADALMRRYVEWVKKIHTGPRIHPEVDLRGEPKFFINNGSADYPWYSMCMRPQNDGPGLRARVLSEYAMSILRSGPLHDKAEAMKVYEVVKYDLDYVRNNLDVPTCEPWEEKLSSSVFYVTYTMRAGLMVGADLARQVGEAGLASEYLAAARSLEGRLAAHFNASGGYVFEDTNDTKAHRDSTVILAFSDGDVGDGLYSPLSHDVIRTVIAYNALFCAEYPINIKDTQAGIPGIMYGRYGQDTYCGGNPWILATAGLAQLIYRTALAALKLGAVDHATYALLQDAYGLDAGLEGAQLADALLGAADGVMLRIKHHVAADDFHMREQIDRLHGHQLSAADLTWSYANVLKALHARDEYVASRVGADRLAAVWPLEELPPWSPAALTLFFLVPVAALWLRQRARRYSQTSLLKQQLLVA